MTFFVLDAYNLLYRSFCSLPPTIVDGDGLPINAVYGLFAFLVRLRRDEGARHMVAAFDEPTVPTFRHRLYPPYQAQRGPLGGEQSNEFLRQVGMAKRVLPHVGVAALSLPGYEADDIMGSVAHRARSAHTSACIVTTDRDALQLVGDGTVVLAPGSPPTIARDDQDVRTRLGVPASGVTTFKALCGDVSDNIPGVRGIGKKTAASLVNTYADLHTIYAHLDDLPARTRSLLASERDHAFLFLRLVTIVTDLQLPLAITDLPEVQFSARDRVRALLESAASASKKTGMPGGIRTPDL